MIKKSSKFLSAFLATLMVLSVFMPTLAAGAVSAVESLEAEIAAYESFGYEADPGQEKLDEFNSLVSSYAALSVAQKEQVDVFLFDKLFRAVFDYGRAVYKRDNDPAPVKDQAIYGNGLALSELSPPDFMDKAADLAGILNDKNKDAEEKYAAFAAADEYARLYVDAWYPSYGVFQYPVTSYPTKALELVVTQYGADKVAETPNPDPKIPTAGVKPQPRNYPLGEEDPDYIADLADWLVRSEKYYTWFANDKMYLIGFEIEMLDRALTVAPEYAPFWNLSLQMLDVKLAFDSGEDVKAEAQEAVDAFDALSDLDQLRLEKYTKYFYYSPLDRGDSWFYTYYRASQLLAACQDIVNAKFLEDFINLIDSIEEPYTREDINISKEARGKVPSSLVSSIPAEILAKYNAILASIGPDIPSEDLPQLEDLPSTKVKYPLGMNKKNAVQTYKALEGILVDGLGLDLKALLSEELYTNKMVGTIAAAVYPLLGEQSSLIAQGPNDLATKLDEEKFAGARVALEAAVSEYNDNGAPIKNLEDWNNVVFKNGDWGFEDGDREGFLDAAAASFRALSILTLVLTFENKISTTAGTYTYHAYEDLVVLFESLGLRGVMSSHDYTLAVDAETNGNKKMDYRIRPILVPVANLLDDMADDLMGTLLGLLPNLARSLNSGVLNDQLNKIISEIKLVSIDPPDLTSAGFFNLIAPMLGSMELAPGLTLDLNLGQDRFLGFLEDLEGCGDYTVKESVSRTDAYIATIDADKADTFVVLFYYLHSELTAPENVQSFHRTIKGLDLGTYESFAIRLLLNVIVSLPAPFALNITRVLLPFANIILGFSKVF